MYNRAEEKAMKEMGYYSLRPVQEIAYAKFKENTSYKEFDGGWYLVKIEDNELNVIINRNETNASRSFTLCVEAGNAFDEFKFVQDAARQ